jgi:hypothetical protein
MSKSIYGGRTIGAITKQQIYGNVINGVDPTQCCTVVQPSIPPIQILQQMVALIEKMKSAIEKFYPAGQSISQYIGEIKLSIRLPFTVIVRLRWIELYATETIVDIDGNISTIKKPFDKNSEVHHLQLKDLYLAAGRDWRTDPMFIALGLV